MSLTIFLAQFFGLVLLIKGLFVLLRADRVRHLVDRIEKEELMMTVVGMVVTVLGVFLVMIHTTWGTSLEMVVSVLSWVVLLKGILALFAPKSLIEFASGFTTSDSDIRGFAIVVLIVAIYLLAQSF